MDSSSTRTPTSPQALPVRVSPLGATAAALPLSSGLSPGRHDCISKGHASVVNTIVLSRELNSNTIFCCFGRYTMRKEISKRHVKSWFALVLIVVGLCSWYLGWFYGLHFSSSSTCPSSVKTVIGCPPLQTPQQQQQSSCLGTEVTSGWKEPVATRVPTPTPCVWQASSAPACHAEQLRPGPVALSYHQNPDFLLVSFGSGDYVSSLSRNDGIWFEDSTRDLILRFLSATTTSPKGIAESCAEAPVWYLDVGANIGLHSLAAASAGFPVFALEAQQATSSRLACSKQINNFPHLALRRVALGPTRGVLCMSNEKFSSNVGGFAVGLRNKADDIADLECKER